MTEKLSIPKIGHFADVPDLSLYFYDGAECLRPLDQNPEAAKRPRGYSCEEIGGLAWGWDEEFPKLRKLSVDFPFFISPHGTGCSRYVSATFIEDGSVFATVYPHRSRIPYAFRKSIRPRRGICSQANQENQ